MALVEEGPARVSEEALHVGRPATHRRQTPLHILVSCLQAAPTIARPNALRYQALPHRIHRLVLALLPHPGRRKPPTTIGHRPHQLLRHRPHLRAKVLCRLVLFARAHRHPGAVGCAVEAPAAAPVAESATVGDQKPALTRVAAGDQSGSGRVEAGEAVDGGEVVPALEEGEDGLEGSDLRRGVEGGGEGGAEIREGGVEAGEERGRDGGVGGAAYCFVTTRWWVGCGQAWRETTSNGDER